jgi:hypothetical protein
MMRVERILRFCSGTKSIVIFSVLTVKVSMLTVVCYTNYGSKSKSKVSLSDLALAVGTKCDRL